MRITNRRLLPILALLFCFAHPKTEAQSVSVPLTPDRWMISQRNFKLTQKDASRNGEVGDFLGRTSFRLSRGLASARGIDFKNGTIDLEMAPGPNGRFLGIAFHVQSDDSYEVIFFRPGASGTDQASNTLLVCLGRMPGKSTPPPDTLQRRTFHEASGSTYVS